MGQDREGLGRADRLKAVAPAFAHRRELLVVGDAHLDVLIDGTGPALVLLPSSLRDSLDFDVLAGLLAREGFQVLRPQPRGMGRSSAPSEGMTLASLADDVAAVVRHFAAAPAVVVGHAYGHWVARMTALRHPDRVRGVVALAAAARVFPAGIAESLAVASDPGQPEAARVAALRHCMFAPGNDPLPWLEGWHPQWRRAYREASSAPPRDSWYAHRHGPMLDLQGAQDAWRPPATRREFAEALGDDLVTIDLIEGAGHAMVPEQPEAVARAVARWSRQIGHAG